MRRCSIRTAAGAVALFGLGGIVAMLRAPRWRARGALLLALVIPWTLLYGAYYWSLTGPRFLLPVFTLFVLAAVGLLHLLPTLFLRGAVAVVLAGWHLTVAVGDGLPRMERLADELTRGRGHRSPRPTSGATSPRSRPSATRRATPLAAGLASLPTSLGC